jgi:hypothetical protein
MKFIIKSSILLTLFCSTAVFSQTEAEELAKKLANPVASLISIPFQNNTDYGIGANNGVRNTLNFQPVVPVSLTKDINLITRMVLPIVTQYNITGAGEKQSGLADAVVSMFFSPKNTKNGFTWGAGPALLFPTGTNDFLTTDKWGVGPTAVALKQVNGWTIGGLVNQIWSIAGSDDRPDVSQMFVEPFVIYNWKSGAGAGLITEWTQNWEIDKATVWITPTFSGVTSFGSQKVQFLFGPRFNVAANSDNAKADLGWRAGMVFLFPK